MICDGCGHARTHHGALVPVNGDPFAAWLWKYEPCWVWVKDSPRKGHRCRCSFVNAEEDDR